MSLQEKIKGDLKVAMKAKDEDKKNAIRVIMGEFGRMESKALSDDEVIKVIKKLIKSEKERMASAGETESGYVEILESYLPQMASEEDIRAWIEANIDFSEFKNKMQAMKPIMAHFGASVDGNTVKKVLGEM